MNPAPQAGEQAVKSCPLAWNLCGMSTLALLLLLPPCLPEQGRGRSLCCSEAGWMFGIAPGPGLKTRQDLAQCPSLSLTLSASGQVLLCQARCLFSHRP